MLLLLLKKLMARLLFPVPLILILLAAGLLLRHWPRGDAALRRRLRLSGNVLLLAGLTLLLLASLTGTALLRHLGSRYSPLALETLTGHHYTLAVAGSGFSFQPELPAERWFNDAMQLRLHEAGRVGQYLNRNGIPFRVLACVSGEADLERKRQAAACFLAQYGIAAEVIEVIPGALNSRQEILAIRELQSRIAPPETRLVMISEAFHVPRLMRLCRRYGVEALQAPATRGAMPYPPPLSLVPSGQNLADCEKTVYEYLGMLEACF